MFSDSEPPEVTHVSLCSIFRRTASLQLIEPWVSAKVVHGVHEAIFHLSAAPRRQALTSFAMRRADVVAGSIADLSDFSTCTWISRNNQSR